MLLACRYLPLEKQDLCSWYKQKKWLLSAMAAGIVDENCSMKMVWNSQIKHHSIFVVIINSITNISFLQKKKSKWNELYQLIKLFISTAKWDKIIYKNIKLFPCLTLNVTAECCTNTATLDKHFDFELVISYIFAFSNVSYCWVLDNEGKWNILVEKQDSKSHAMIIN